MNIDYLLAFSSWCTAAAGLAHVIRIAIRERTDVNLARHTFDTTGSTDALDGYSRLTAARRSRSPSPWRPKRESVDDPPTKT